MSKLITKRSQLKVGDIYEDCFYNPCLCVEIDGNDVYGISLVDGSYPHCCSIVHCAIQKLTVKEAMVWRENKIKQ